MCLTPSYVWVERGPSWEKQPVPCKNCWQCHSNHVNDYVGRCLAEAAYSDWTVAVTLTYRNDEGAKARADLADKVLTPSHFQNFIRSVRKRGHKKQMKVRYLAVGEHGSLKDRCHFHAVLFGKGPRPEWPHQERFWPEEWPHGHVYADWSADDKAVRYVCKYLQKWEGVDQVWFSPSKYPPLGHEFFMSKAREAASLGVLPSSFNYMPPGGRKNYPYMMRGATRRDYFLKIVELLDEDMPSIRARLGEWPLKTLDKILREAAVKNGVYPPTEKFMEAFAEEVNKSRMSDRAVNSVLAATNHNSVPMSEW